MLGAFAASCTPTLAADRFPSRQIKIVLPFAAGGGTDAVARILAQQVSAQMGVPVVIENKAGANGNLGAEAAAKADPDGYTFLYNTSFVATNPWFYKKVGYDTQKDFEPVLLIAKVPLVLVTKLSVPARSLREFIDYARANPGKLTYASSGTGGSTHLANLLFQRAAGIQAVHVAYRGGAPALNDLLVGSVDFYMDTLNTALPMIQDGRIRALAVTTRERVPEIADVPSVMEAVRQEIEVVSWQGLLAPAGTPRAVIERVNAEFLRALAEPSLRARLSAQSAIPLGSTPEEYRRFIATESEVWKRLIAEAKVSAD